LLITTNEKPLQMPVEYVVLVNKNNQPLGTMEKLEAHERGELHRAFSVFIFNSEGQMMLQKRADGKYHSPGLWTNTVCSHPRTGEDFASAAHRRLMEEMGFDCELEPAFTFIYKAHVGDGLIEHEFDQVFIGTCDKEPQINPEEVGDWKYVWPGELYADIERFPDEYTVWFKIAIKQLKKYLDKK